MTIIMGLGLLLLTLAAFSLFSMKAPKGSAAMSGMVNAAVATFLVEAVRRYISGDLLHLAFLGETGTISGNMGGVVAAIMVPIGVGANPVFVVVAGVALEGYGILPGFIAGYAIGFIAPFIEKHLPPGLNSVLGAFLVALIARFIALLVDPAVNVALTHIGGMITAAIEQSPILMGLLLGGVIKMICTSPLSSTALTAMLGLTGLSMGTTTIACFGSSFINGAIFKMLYFGDNSNVTAVMMEPLTQAYIIAKHPIPIYCSDFFGGGFSGVAVAFLSVIDNVPGTAFLIPGLLTPFAFSPLPKALMALLLATISGTLAGIVGVIALRKKYDMKPELSVINSFEEQKHSVGVARWEGLSGCFCLAS